MPKDINLRFRVWVFAGDIPFLGVGPVELLEKIIEHGSIAKAAEAMKMSYRKAWQLVQNMNEIADSPMVITKLGGVKGGGTEVTAKGKQLIEQYHFLEKDMEDFLSEKVKRLKW